MFKTRFKLFSDEEPIKQYHTKAYTIHIIVYSILKYIFTLFVIGKDYMSANPIPLSMFVIKGPESPEDES